jgi:hypothetical protein
MAMEINLINLALLDYLSKNDVTIVLVDIDTLIKNKVIVVSKTGVPYTDGNGRQWFEDEYKIPNSELEFGKTLIRNANKRHAKIDTNILCKKDMNYLFSLKICDNIPLIEYPIDVIMSDKNFCENCLLKLHDIALKAYIKTIMTEIKNAI